MVDGWASFGATPYVTPASTDSSQPPPRPQVAVLEAHPDATGQLAAVLTPAGSGRIRYVTRITVSTPGATNTLRAYVYVGAALPEALVMGTRAGQLDYAVESPPLFIPEDTQLTIRWDAGPTRALARIEYVEE